LLSLIFEPSIYFESRLRRGPQWFLASMGPLLCFFLHWIAFTVIHKKLAGEIEAILAPHIAGPMALSWIYVMDFFGAAGYVVVPAFAVVAVICIDILTKGTDRFQRFFELAGFCFYALVPYVALVLILSLLFEPPEVSAYGPFTRNEIPDLVRDYMISVRQTPIVLLIQNLGLLFHAWLAFLIVVAYRTVSPCSRKTAFGLMMVVFGLIFLAN
jgi:hypothetical protein